MQLRFAIKICPSDPKWAMRWGDTHFAQGLLEALERRGHKGRIDLRKTWYKRRLLKDHVVIHLQGLAPYTPGRGSFNILWVISHPEDQTTENLGRYDLIFVASNLAAKKMAKMTDKPVLPLLQCTDPGRFYLDPEPGLECDLLFLGNTRHIFRPIIKDLLPTDYNLKVIGREWEKHIDSKYLMGEYYPNEQARKLYSSCKILLNDHHQGMRDFGMINNRIYDGLACGAFIVSDAVKDEDFELSDYYTRYEGREDLREKVDYYINHPEERKVMAEEGREAVLARHTFDCRADEILAALKARL